MPDSWDAHLREPFPPEKIFAKPRVWCGDCRDAQGKVCHRHNLLNPCPRCGQRITSAHVDLDYVGHADVTERLLDTDPHWFWHPAWKNPDKDVLLAAIATGNEDIVATVMDNAPPWVDQFGGMWMYLTVHDDNGNEITRLGYGDADRKTGPSAVKEVIGDGIRNAAMRFGVALDLWSKSDRADGKPAEDPRPGQTVSETQTATARPGHDQRDSHPTTARPGGQEETTPINERAQVLASLALDLVQRHAYVLDLKTEVYDVAKIEHILDALVINPFTANITQLSTVITAAKKTLTEYHSGISQEEPG